MTIVTLEKTEVDRLFEESEHQIDVVLGLYKMVWPNWDDIESIDGWPSVNEWTAHYLMERFISFDIRHHPNVMNGGLWMNKGFSRSHDKDLEDWQVHLTGVTVELI